MPNRFFVTFISFFIFCGFSAKANTITATIDGMTCISCVKGVEDQLKANPKVDQVTIDLDQGKVVATAKKGNTLVAADMQKAIDYMGFTVKKMTVGE